jgi:hypothetical protein
VHSVCTQRLTIPYLRRIHTSKPLDACLKEATSRRKVLWMLYVIACLTFQMEASFLGPGLVAAAELSLNDRDDNDKFELLV